MANAFKTPEHIAPVWYFTPFYAILRAVPDKLLGVIAMGAAIAVLFVLPWLDRSPVKSMKYKGWMSKIALLAFCISFIILGVLGVLSPTPERTLVSRICTAIYFGYFILMPFYTKLEKTKVVPEGWMADEKAICCIDSCNSAGLHFRGRPGGTFG